MTDDYRSIAESLFPSASERAAFIAGIFYSKVPKKATIPGPFFKYRLEPGEDVGDYGYYRKDTGHRVTWVYTSEQLKSAWQRKGLLTEAIVNDVFYISNHVQDGFTPSEEDEAIDLSISHFADFDTDTVYVIPDIDSHLTAVVGDVWKTFTAANESFSICAPQKGECGLCGLTRKLIIEYDDVLYCRLCKEKLDAAFAYCMTPSKFNLDRLQGY